MIIRSHQIRAIAKTLDCVVWLHKSKHGFDLPIEIEFTEPYVKFSVQDIILVSGVDGIATLQVTQADEVVGETKVPMEFRVYRLLEYRALWSDVEEKPKMSKLWQFFHERSTTKGG